MNWIDDLANAAQPLDDMPIEPQLTPLGNTVAELTAQLAEASAMPKSWLVQQYIAEAKRRLAKLGAA